MTIQAIPYIFMLGFLFGSTLVVSRFSVSGQFSPTNYIGLRLLIAASIHLLVYLFSSQRKFPKDPLLWRRAFLYGVVGTALPMTAIVTGLQYVSSGIASIMITLNPAVVAVLAHFTLDDERLTNRKILGVTLALGGAIQLALRGESGLPDISGSLIGYLLLTVAVIAGSGATIYARRYMRTFDSFDVASIRMGAAAVTVVPLAFIFVGFDFSQTEPIGYGGLLYASLVGTFSGLMLNFYITKHFSALASSSASYVIPIVATIGGALFLQEIITMWMILGMAIILIGITLLREPKAAALRARKTQKESSKIGIK